MVSSERHYARAAARTILNACDVLSGEPLRETNTGASSRASPRMALSGVTRNLGVG